jgi:uracil-DNA glycosylase
VSRLPPAVFHTSYRTPRRVTSSLLRFLVQSHNMSGLKRKAGQQAGSDAKKVKQNGTITSFFGAPKSANAGTPSKAGGEPEPPAPKFDKVKWVNSLTAEQKDLLRLEISTLHDSWLAHLKDDIMSKEFLELKRFLARETSSNKKWFPPPGDVYSW